MTRRPRLADHAQVRRHLVDGREVVVIHDARTHDLLRLDPEPFAALVHADGTRDLDGVLLAASRAGAYRRRSELVSMLDELQARGLLAEGVDGPRLDDPPEETPSDRPLDVLDRITLVCDGSGTCCRQYGSVAFTLAEATRARALVPTVLDGLERPDRVFLPLVSNVAREHLAVTLVDGACAYLATDGACSIHRAGGAEAKPRPCSIYPSTFVDDGVHVRVSVKVECPCVVDSFDRDDGAPLVSPSQRTRGALEGAVTVRALVDRPAITRDRGVARAVIAAWSRVIAAEAPSDVALAFWSLADAVETHGLDSEQSRAALVATRYRRLDDLARWTKAFATMANESAKVADEWRSPRDAVRLGRRAIADAAKLVCEQTPTPLAAPSSQAIEQHYFRATIFGHHAVESLPLVDALRDRAVRVLVARAIGDRRTALPTVESMCRGHGLAAYASRV